MFSYSTNTLSNYFLVLISIGILLSCTTETETIAERTTVPVQISTLDSNSIEEKYGELFYDVQKSKTIFRDSKVFVDCIPLYASEKIRKDYLALKDKSEASILAFIKYNFILPNEADVYVTDSSSINEHISKLWSVLSRPADTGKVGTLIALPYPYIVPGGRFREVYYWDSYFTMLGLQADGKVNEMENIVKNFSFLIDSFGFIPNGNRTYYLSRSQPPFYALMVALLAEEKSDNIYKTYLPYLVKEYSFWMNGVDSLNSTKQAYRRVVQLPNGEILNRYWDDKNTPRPESYLEDVETAHEAMHLSTAYQKDIVYRSLRAAAESGWDFSSRWIEDDQGGPLQLAHIHTTDILPVDLNTLLYNLENTIAKGYQLSGDSTHSKLYTEKAVVRKNAILRYFWNEEEGFFMDVDFIKSQQTSCFSIAGVYPLFFNIASNKQASAVREKIKNEFLKSGGVVATLNKTRQQWDAPNGWAPLQWITIQGLRNYGYTQVANTIKERWLGLNKNVYSSTYKLLEKYNVVDLSVKGGGGEYPNQDGFGWTNGVYQKLSKE